MGRRMTRIARADTTAGGRMAIHNLILSIRPTTITSIRLMTTRRGNISEDLTHDIPTMVDIDTGVLLRLRTA